MLRHAQHAGPIVARQPIARFDDFAGGDARLEVGELLRIFLNLPVDLEFHARADRHAYTPSSRVATPWPTPTHKVARPRRALVLRISWTSVVTSRAPLQPSGWPRAMAPPLGFTFAFSRPSSRMQARTW